jgi:cytochrome c oxidase subunit III
MNASVAPEANNKFFPKEKILMGIAIAAMIMLFAGLTSAYIIHAEGGHWQYFKLPSIFWVNTAVILTSSFTLQWALVSYKKFRYNAYRIAITITTILGIGFIAGQYLGWRQLTNMGIYLDGNASGSFLYVISGTHAVHVLGGVIALLVVTIAAFVKPFNPNKLLRVELISIYWHFVDVLWLYLFIFFQIKF